MEIMFGVILVFAWGVLAGCWLRTRQIKAWPALYGLRRKTARPNNYLSDLLD